MDNEIVWREVFGEITPVDETYLKALAHPFAQQARQFHPADILARRHMGTGFGYQHMRTVCKPGYALRSLFQRHGIALVGGEEHGEGCQPTVGRLLSVHLRKDLRIGDYQVWTLTERGESSSQLVGSAAGNDAPLVEQFTDGLHLWQDKASLRCLLVLWHHEQHPVALGGKTARDGLLAEIGRQELEQQLHHLGEPAAAQGADCHGGHIQFAGQTVGCLFCIRHGVCLAQDKEPGGLLELEPRSPLPFFRREHWSDSHQNYDVGLLHGSLHLANAQMSQLPVGVVKSRCVDNHTSSQSGEFGSLSHGVGSSSCHAGHDRNVLSQPCVEQ